MIELNGMTRDIRQALGLAFRHRSLFLVGVLGLGTAVGTAVSFGAVLYGLAWRSIPFTGAERFVTLSESNHDTGVKHLPMTESAYPIFRGSLAAFDDIAAFVPAYLSLFNVRLHDTRESLRLVLASAELAPLIGATPILGRWVSEGDCETGADAVVVLSHAFWTRAFGGDPAILGRRIAIDAFGDLERYTVVGVMPAEFEFPYPLYAKPDVWVPLVQVRRGFRPSQNFLVIGRMRPGISLSQAQADLDSVTNVIARAEPRYYGAISVHAAPLRSELRHHRTLMLGLIWSGIGIVLISFANLVHALTTSVIARRDEFAVRSALGASSSSLFRLVALDAAVLVLVGGAAGFFLAYVGLRVLVASLPGDLTIVGADALLNEPLVLVGSFALVASLVLGLSSTAWLLFRWTGGVVGAARAPSAFYRRRARTHVVARGLLVCQIAITFALLSGAVTVAMQLRDLLGERERFAPDQLLALELVFANNAPGTGVSEIEDLIAELSAMPQVKAAAVAGRFPPSDGLFAVTASGGAAFAGGTQRPSQLNVVSPGYLAVVGHKLLAGRWLSASDTPAPGVGVAVVNEVFAEHYLQDSSPIGMRLRIAHDVGNMWPAEWRVVGIVRESPNLDPSRHPVPTVYIPWTQAPLRNVSIVLRTDVPARQVATTVRDRAVAIGAGLADVASIKTGSDIVAQSLAYPQVIEQHLNDSAFVSLVLALVGVYSIVSFTSALRTRELAIRAAVGATRTSLVRLILRETTTLFAAAVLFGLPPAVLLRYTIGSIEPLLRTGQSLPIVLSAVLLYLLTLAAAAPSARRAAAADAAMILRGESAGHA